jgi:hypothetical protein
MRISLRLLAILSSLVGVTAACSGSSSVPLGRPSADDAGIAAPLGGGSLEDSPSEASAPLDGGAPPDGTAPATSCTSEATRSACQTCCYGAHQEGSVYLVGQMAACECGATGPCEADCATTLCATPVVAADTTCTACVEDNLSTTCASVLTTCAANPDCEAVMGCLQTCAAKP